MTDERQQMFIERYQIGSVPWDTNITPPEIVAIAAELPPGKALDLGCGTGTNVRYMLEKGWEADGIDFVPQAVEMARAKLAGFPAERYTVLCHDVTLLDQVTGLRAPFDLLIDIGCGHGLPLESQPKYVRDCAALLKPGGVFMVYAHAPTETRAFGWSPDDIQRLFTADFDLVQQVLSIDTTNQSPSGWYRLARK